MRIIERYILKEFVKSFFYCLAVFIFMYIMADLFNYIDEMIKNRVAISSVLAYYSNFVPSIFVQVAPIAVLLSTVYILSDLNRHNEITALRAGGVSLWNIIRPLLIAGLLLSIVVFLANDKLVPRSLSISNKIRKDEIRSTGNKKTEDNILKNITIYGTKNRIIYVRAFDTKKDMLKEIIILEHDENQNIVAKSSAQEAYWQDGTWVFRELSTYNLDNAGHIVGTPSFYHKKTYDLDETPEDLKRLQWRTEFMSYNELKNYISRFSGSGLKTTNELLVDLHHKISFPFVSLIVIVIAAPLALLPTRGGFLMGIGISIVVVLAYYAISAIGLALGKSGMILPLLSAWMPNLFFLGLGIYLMRKRK